VDLVTIKKVEGRFVENSHADFTVSVPRVPVALFVIVDILFVKFIVVTILSSD
jgi:hypothetical protein